MQMPQFYLREVLAKTSRDLTLVQQSVALSVLIEEHAI